jgi:hypothetical protein
MPTYTEMDITPELAARWLENNHLNRAVRPRKVDQYAEQMRAGNWLLNGSGIVRDTEGKVADGQHRLLAVCRARATVRMLVVENVDPAVRITIDENIKRQFHDDLRMMGVRNGQIHSALFRKILIWDKYEGLAHLAKTATPRAQMSKEWPGYGNEVMETSRMTAKWRDRWPGNSGSLAFCYWLLYYRENNDPGTVQQFFSTICTGSKDPGDRVLVQLGDKLRGQGSYIRRVPEEMRGTGTMDAAVEVFYTLRAWTAWLNGERLTKFQLPNGGITDPYFPKGILKAADLS